MAQSLLPVLAMPESDFWGIVEKVKSEAGSNPRLRVSILQRELAKISAASIHAFQVQYERLLIVANQWSLWGAAYLMNEGGCSDDGFKYFRDWLISEGRETFEAALADPESLVKFQAGVDYSLESYGYAALKAYAQFGIGELPRSLEVEIAKPKGTEWVEQDLPKLYPKLAAKFSGK